MIDKHDVVNPQPLSVLCWLTIYNLSWQQSQPDTLFRPCCLAASWPGVSFSLCTPRPLMSLAATAWGTQPPPQIDVNLLLQSLDGRVKYFIKRQRPEQPREYPVLVTSGLILAELAALLKRCFAAVYLDNHLPHTLLIIEVCPITTSPSSSPVSLGLLGWWYLWSWSGTNPGCTPYSIPGFWSFQVWTPSLPNQWAEPDPSRSITL